MSDDWIELFHEGKSVGKLNIRSTFTRDISGEIRAKHEAQIKQRDEELAKLKAQLQEAVELHDKQLKEKEEAFESLKAKTEEDYRTLLEEKESIKA